jgi:Cd2+/Zn2+-exporting ATPase
VEVPVARVPVGEVVLVRPAERIPVDGRVAGGHSAVDQSPITGESVPVDKGPDDEVFAGTINGDGARVVCTPRAVGDRTLDRVIQLVEEAQTQKAPTQRFTERFESWFVPAVLIADVLVILLPPLLGLWTWSTSFYRGMALLVGASPCALALGTPAAVLAGIAQAARKGVLIKGGVHLENLGTLRAMAFDKTGTLTAGRPEVTETVPLGGATAGELLRIAGAVERKSEHPLAKAIVRRSAAAGVVLPEAGELHSFTALGVRGEVAGERVEIGSLRLWERNGESGAAAATGAADKAGAVVPEAVTRAAASLQASGRSVVVVRHGGRWLGALGLSDQPRPGVSAVLERMRALGIRPLVMLTGDNAAVAEAVGRAVGVDEVRAGLLPEQKVDAVKSLMAAHGRVGMVGDGVNDAPALASATVGVAMGGAGTAAALETADVALMGDDLTRLLFGVELSRKANSIIRQNLGIALGVIVVLSVFAVAGVVRIGPAVFFHEGSTLVVIFNALRLLAFEGTSRRADAAGKDAIGAAS